MQLGTKPSTISEAKKGLSSPLKGCFSDAVTFVCSNGVSSVVFSMMLSRMTMVKPNISLWGYQNIVLLLKFVCHYFFFVIQFFSIFRENTRLWWHDFDRWGGWNQPKSIAFWKYFFHIFFVFGNWIIFFMCEIEWKYFQVIFFYFLAICRNWINHGNITRIIPWIYDYYFLKINCPQDKYNPGFNRLRVKAQIPESKMM